MFVHRLFLSKKLSIVSKKPLNILKQLNANNDFSTTGTSFTNYKDNTSDQMNVSLFNIKKSLRLANTEFEDGFTNLKTRCPVCEPVDVVDGIYINKTTGENPLISVRKCQ